MPLTQGREGTLSPGSSLPVTDTTVSTRRTDRHAAGVPREERREDVQQGVHYPGYTARYSTAGTTLRRVVPAVHAYHTVPGVLPAVHAYHTVPGVLRVA